MTIGELNAFDQSRFVEAVDGVFEGSPWVAQRSCAYRPFVSLDQLKRVMASVIESASRADQLALLCAHPDLGTRAQLSPSSTTEQTSAGLNRLTDQERQRFRELNEAYRNKFRFPFLFAVKGSNKFQILQALERRLNSTPDEEFHLALQQVYAIAGFRLHELIDDHQEASK